jgi:hypothetical protein
MTDERAKEIAELIRQAEARGGEIAEVEGAASFLLHLYDDIQAIKSAMSGLSFLNAGIQPVRKVDQ